MNKKGEQFFIKKERLNFRNPNANKKMKRKRVKIFEPLNPGFLNNFPALDLNFSTI
jgi:hypothetical protein